jgi:hypothetical protein
MWLDVINWLSSLLHFIGGRKSAHCGPLSLAVTLVLAIAKQ